jgi:microcin C transport system substrate-binding protein
MNRRSFIKSTLLSPAALALPILFPSVGSVSQAEAQTDRNWRHGVSPFGDLKYSTDFKSFDYVNVSAPKAGIARQIALGTYDNFNLVLAGIKGTLAAGIDLVYDTLLVPALDEVSSYYGLIAEALSYPGDFSFVRYRLRAEAKWHDGSPITPDDVIFSFATFKKYSPQAAANYRHVAKVEQTAEREVTFTFDEPGNRTLPQIVGQLTVLPKAWWDVRDPDGQRRDISATTLKPPLGSGPYRIKQFSPGHDIVYERVTDYWGKDLNVNIGRDNFAELRFEYFRDPTVAIEAFKVDAVDWRVENSAKNWSSAYDFSAVSDKRVVLKEFPIRNIAIMQGFAFNIRRQKFGNPLVRLAFNYAFDFEEMNRQMFFGQYKRIDSYFDGTQLAATGLPMGRELELLQSIGQEVPPSVFTTAYSNPIGGNPDAARNNLRQALRLLKQAGYEVRDQQLVDVKTGEPYTIEFLGNNAVFERVFLFYKPSLERIGITVTVRTVDEPQYENRLRNWDFDIITYAWPETLQPGNELRDYWGSQAADQAGSDNVIGIKNPAVDTMIDRILVAKSREDLVAACKALDRLLLWNHYVVPQWSYNKLRVAYWDRFSHPDPLPEYGVTAFPAVWWWDAQKAAKLGSP